jgi:hypothetical protein
MVKFRTFLLLLSLAAFASGGIIDDLAGAAGSGAEKVAKGARVAAYAARPVTEKLGEKTGLGKAAVAMRDAIGRGVDAIKAAFTRAWAVAKSAAQQAEDDETERARLRRQQAQHASRMRTVVWQIYQRCAPDKLVGDFVPALLHRFKGREAQLVRKLRTKKYAHCLAQGVEAEKAKADAGETGKKKKKEGKTQARAQDPQARKAAAQRRAEAEQAKRAELDELMQQYNAQPCEEGEGCEPLAHEGGECEFIDLDSDEFDDAWVQQAVADEAVLALQLTEAEAAAEKSAAAAESAKGAVAILENQLAIAAE